MSATPDYTNPETKDRLDEARKQLQRQEQAETATEVATAARARQDLAEEDQPGRDLPDLTETVTADFRGHEFEFSELGDAMVTAVETMNGEDDVEAGAEGANYIYSLLGEKAVHESADEAYWRQYDLHSDDRDAVMDLFNRLIEAGAGIDEEAREQAREFRNE